MEQFLSLQQNKISYYNEGQGKVIVLLHGFGEDKNIWNYQLEFLKSNYQVIIPDLPGTGNSDLLDKENISINDYANWLHDFIFKIISPHQKIILLGHSMGGYISLAYAKKYPETLAAFGLIHSTAFADSDEKKEIRSRAILSIQKFGTFSFLKNTIPNLFSKQFKKTNSSVIDDLIKQGKTFTKEGLIQYYSAMMNRIDSTDVLINSEVPVLFVMGEEDIAAPLRDVLQQCHLPKKSYVHILENVAHMGMLEATEKLNSIIENFAEDIIVH